MAGAAAGQPEPAVASVPLPYKWNKKHVLIVLGIAARCDIPMYIIEPMEDTALIDASIQWSSVTKIVAFNSSLSWQRKHKTYRHDIVVVGVCV